MKLFDEILATTLDGEVVDVRVGMNWTAVVVDVGGTRRCGLATTLSGFHEHSGEPQILQAGTLVGRSTSELVADLYTPDSPQMSLAMATLNALLPPPLIVQEQNAMSLIASRGQGKHVALVGHFPFVKVLRSQVGHLSVIDQHPLEGDYPANAAPDILPQADFIAITGMVLMNGTFESLMALRPPDTEVMLLGPSTPLSPVLFDYGVSVLAGALIENIDTVLQTVGQGGNFRQVHRAGVRLITCRK